MKKFILTALLIPFFAGAQDSLRMPEAYDGIVTPSAAKKAVDIQGTDLQVFRRWRSVRCGRHSDFECRDNRVFDSCEKDSSHGYYGKCYNIAQRGPEVVCTCR